MTKWPKKSRGFVVTNWNCCRQILQSLVQSKQFRYIAWGEEVCPTTGRKHWQTFCYTTNSRSTSTKALGGMGAQFGEKPCHVEPMMGSFLENEAYCAKDTAGVLAEIGKRPEPGARGDITEIKDLVLDGKLTADDVCVTDPIMFHQYGRTIDRLETIALRKQWRTWMTKGIWYTGPSGSGKSHAVFTDYDPDTHYIKDLSTDWWDGYKGQPIVIFNEFRGNMMSLSKLFDLVDKWPTVVKWRNKESVPFLAKELRITCIHAPRCAYSGVADDEPWAQFDRRFEIRKLEQRCPEGNNETSGPKWKVVDSGDSDLGETPSPPMGINII